jgi:Hypothetical glycosyl hydrolase family 15
MGAKSSLSITIVRSWQTLLPGLCLLLFPQWARGQNGSGGQPVRYQAQYTRIYFDDFETLAPSLGRGFVLDIAGSLTSSPSEVISGSESIKGSYSGSGTYTGFLHSDPSIIPLSPNHSYQVTFQYKILTAPDKGFEVLFYSPTGGAAGNFLPSVTITGAAGTTGTATLTNALGPYTDYVARWDIEGTGAISIDNIQLIDTSTGKVIAAENAEGTAPTVGSGLQLQHGASVVTDPALVIGGKASISLANFGTVATAPAVVSLGANTTYIVEFPYLILNPGSGPTVLFAWFQPAGTTGEQFQVTLQTPLKNSAARGTFSTGAQTAGAGSWVLNLEATADSSVIIDNISIFRQDAEATSVAPSNWAVLDRLPFPRLGRYMFAPANSLAQYPEDGIPQFTHTQAELENRIAFADVIVGLEPYIQTQAPDFIRTIRQLNPNVVFLPYRIAEEQGFNWPAPYFNNLDPQYAFQQNFADDWLVRDTKGNYIEEKDFPGVRIANISPFGSIDRGQTYTGAVLNWLTGELFPSGLWDGVFFDNLFGRVNPHIPNSGNPGLLDYDWNRNGIRDETPALSSEMTRIEATQMLQDFQTKTRGLELAIGNAGPLPEIALAPYVNGYVFECFNDAWNAWLPNQSSAKWRAALDAYRSVQSSARKLAMNIIEACGSDPPSESISSRGQLAPTAEDIQRHRFAMGTSLLSNGFYFYGIAGNLSTPDWYDEYSVDKTGTAVEDRSSKGYLGQPLSDAAELTDGGTLIFSENFEGPARPASFNSGSGPTTVTVTHSPAEVISGSGSLTIGNPDHTTLFFTTVTTVPGAIPFIPGNTYRIVFDWRVLETVDGNLNIDFGDSGGTPVYAAPGLVAGDSGTADFPASMPSSTSNWIIRFVFIGGGKIAIDNLRVYQGGAGP